jgi:hypothetical protein
MTMGRKGTWPHKIHGDRYQAENEMQYQQSAKIINHPVDHSLPGDKVVSVLQFNNSKNRK